MQPNTPLMRVLPPAGVSREVLSALVYVQAWKAMQPYTAEFAKTELTPQGKEIVINKHKYRADLKNGVVVEKGPKGTKKYKIEHLLGGKNVYYFLTLLAKGRLQTLPLAYDVNKKNGSILQQAVCDISLANSRTIRLTGR